MNVVDNNANERREQVDARFFDFFRFFFFAAPFHYCCLLYWLLLVMLRVRVKLLLLFAAEVEENEIHWKRLGAAGIFFETKKSRSPSHSHSVAMMIVCGLSDKPILTSRTKIPSPWLVRLPPSFFSELLQLSSMTGHCPIAVPPSSSSCGRLLYFCGKCHLVDCSHDALRCFQSIYFRFAVGALA